MARMSERADMFAIFADGRDWHVRQLLGGLERRGIATIIVPLEKVGLSIAAPPAEPILLPGFDGRLPKAAFVRSISAGSFEAVTLRLGILHSLEAAGVTVWNPARAVEICVDKSATSLAFQRSGLPTPMTYVTEAWETACEIVARETGAGHRLVLKPLFGAQGKGLRLIGSIPDLPERAEAQGVYYLQRFVPPAESIYRDYRVLVSAGRVIAAMRRQSDSWITNVHQGGRPEAWDPPADAASLAIAATQVTGATFAGVDLIEDGAGGYMVLEVNSMPAWSGLQSVSNVAIGDLLAGDFADAAAMGLRV